MPIITISSGKTFESGPSESLVDGAARSQIILPHSCRTGRCATCKSRVTSGETSPMYAESGLSAAERSNGWILTCVRKADSDVVLDVEDLGSLSVPPVKTVPCRIAAIDVVADDIIRVRLRLPPTAQFKFLAGQYIDVIAEGGVRRSYSLAAAPTEPQLELHIRSTPNGVMSKYWFGCAKVNDLLRLNGPLGTFFLRDVSGLDLVFLATGTGIAPVKAMLEGLRGTAPCDLPRSVTVYWGGRVPSDLYWDPSAVPAEFRLVPVLSRANQEWTGRRGHVQDVFITDHPNLGESAVYACGSEAMINEARALLTGAGLPEQRFYSDAFVCSAVAK